MRAWYAPKTMYSQALTGDTKLPQNGGVSAYYKGKRSRPVHTRNRYFANSACGAEANFDTIVIEIPKNKTK